MQQTLSGKARGILLRLPHFYAPTEAGDLLVQFVETLGRSIERAEEDLYRVLHAHHVETADNVVVRPGSRGDLDRVLALYLDAVGGTSQLVKVSPAFTTRSIDPRKLARSLVREDAPLCAYVRARVPPEEWRALQAFQVENAAVLAEEISHELAMDVLLARTPLGPYLRDRLSPPTLALLERYDGSGTIEWSLAWRLAADLNERVIGDPALYRKHFAWFEGLEGMEAAATARLLRAAIYGDFLRERTAEPLPDELRIRLRDDLAAAVPVPAPAGDDLRRLNRLLLEAASRAAPAPWGLRSSEIPPVDEVRRVVLRALNALLADPRLFSPDRFPQFADDRASLERRYAGGLPWLNRFLLETAFPDAIEPSHTPYRMRLQGLIQVLRRGASTRQGIVDIVAANLGIVGDDPGVREARALIQIEEYLPERTDFFTGAVPYFVPFEVANPTLLESSPEVRITMLPAPDSPLGERVLANVRIIDAVSKREAKFPGRLRALDQLVMSGGTVLLNGIAPQLGLIGTVPDVAEDGASWVLDADVLVPGTEAGLERALPFGRFDTGVGAGLGTFDRAVLAPARNRPPVTIEVTSYKPNPGIFTVVIPWNIEGFTDKFDERDHPRGQIGGLVARVKAAGVRALVAYRLAFPETLELAAALRLEVSGELLSEDQAPIDDFHADTRQAVPEDHALDDRLELAGRLDYTRFDSANRLA